MSNYCDFSTGNENGAVLVVSLMLLLVMTLIGVTAVQTTTLEEKMSGNARDRELAFHSAEVALREGESYLGQTALPSFNDSSGLYQPDRSLWRSVDWTDSTKVKIASGMDDAVDSDVLARKPSYYLEELAETVTTGTSVVIGFGSPPVIGNYRVTAHGYGGSEAAEVVLQSTYRR